MSKTLVAYFSAEGTTRRVAENLAQAAGADLYEIRPAVPYTRADLNWMDKKSRSSVEMNDRSYRPELADKDADIASCDRIFLGFPFLKWSRVISVYSGVLRGGRRANRYRKHNRKKKCV